MLILALDTTGEKGGIGIFRGAQCLASLPNQDPMNRFSVSLFEMLERALGEARVTLADIELFAVANGPGSFTGIRVGLAAAQAWARAFDRSVRGVSILAAMAEAALRSPNRLSTPPGGSTSSGALAPETDAACGKEVLPEVLIPVLDARRNEFYVGALRRAPASKVLSPGRYEPLDTGWVLGMEELRTYLQDHLAATASVECLARVHEDAVLKARDALPQSVQWRVVEGSLVEATARLAARDQENGQPAVPLDAYYIRRPDAELKR